MKFEHWLKKQIFRNDPIGDLAKDFNLASTVKKYQTIEKSMAMFNPCVEAIEALEQAREEYFNIMGAISCLPSKPSQN